jgi:putative flavoprotein involved in K+ transport
MAATSFRGSGNPPEAFDTIVIGGGQAALAVGYFLARKGKNFIILDENPRTGDAWRKRWDGLRLFTPSKFNALPGARFPKPGNYLPTKDEVADYLEGYAARFRLPIMHGIRVEALSRDTQGYQLSAGSRQFATQNVVVATGLFQLPYTPSFAAQLDRGLFQTHTRDYCNPEQVPAHSILVVGAGNSGAEIALELAKAGKQVWLAGRDVGKLPSNGPASKVLGGWPLWWAINHVLTVKTPMGRKVRETIIVHGGPLGRLTRAEIAAAGVELAPRVSGVQAGKPQLEDGRTLPVEGVIWATGFRPDYSWIALPIFDERGAPRHSRGIVQDAPGLYFIGLMFQQALSSSLLGGVGADAAYIAGRIARKSS